MASIGDVSAPASTINFPRIESTYLPSDGSRQSSRSRNRDRLAGRQSSIVSLQVVDHSPHDGRDRPSCHREIHVGDGAIDDLPHHREALQPTVSSGTSTSAALVGSSQK